MGRKKKPNELKKLSGSRWYDPNIPAARGKPRMPTWLLPDAKWAWKWIVPKLDAIGVLDEVDLPSLMALCSAIGRFKEASEALAVEGNRLAYRTSAGNYAQNPLVGIRNKAEADMFNYASAFGLSPADRDKLFKNMTDDNNNDVDDDAKLEAFFEKLTVA